jgi:hypothetical protein
VRATSHRRSEVGSRRGVEPGSNGKNTLSPLSCTTAALASGSIATAYSRAQPSVTQRACGVLASASTSAAHCAAYSRIAARRASRARACLPMASAAACCPRPLASTCSAATARMPRSASAPTGNMPRRVLRATATSAPCSSSPSATLRSAYAGRGASWRAASITYKLALALTRVPPLASAARSSMASAIVTAVRAPRERANARTAAGVSNASRAGPSGTAASKPRPRRLSASAYASIALHSAPQPLALTTTRCASSSPRLATRNATLSANIDANDNAMVSAAVRPFGVANPTRVPSRACTRTFVGCRGHLSRGTAIDDAVRARDRRS